MLTADTDMVCKKVLLATLMAFAPISVLAESGFLGRWKLESISIADSSSEWAQQKLLPRSIEVKIVDDKMLAIYTDQGGVSMYCNTFNEIIEGNEAILFGCPVPYKSSQIYSPIHRMQLRGKVLSISTVTDKLIYTWQASKVGK